MSRRAFTLIEMIVVLGILTVLLSILMPIVGTARDQANGTLCASHIRTLTQACISFAADHDGHLPGSKSNVWNSANNQDKNPDHWDWLFGKYSMLALEMGGVTWNADGTANVPMSNRREQLMTAPHYGTLWMYVNNNSYSQSDLPSGGSYQTYLCPSLTTSIPGQGLGSNGRFDYAIFAEFDGAAIKDIKPTSVMHYIYNNLPNASNPFPLSTDPRWALADPRYNSTWRPNFNHTWTTQYQVLPTPLVCQEDAMFNINSNLEGQHANTDQMSHLHHGGSYYGSPNGEVTWVNEPDVNLNQYNYEGTWLWETVPPSGKVPVVICNDPGVWNWWAGQ